MKLFALALLAVNMWGATYYIAASGGSDSNNGSTGSRWATFAHAIDSMSAGDTLIVGDGTYHQRIATDGACSSGSRCTIQAEHDGLAIIDGDTNADGVGDLRAPLEIASGHNYWTVTGMVFEHGGRDCDDDQQLCYNNGALAYVTGSYNILQRNSFYNAHPTANSTVVWVMGADNLVEDCIMGGTGRKMFMSFGTVSDVAKRNIFRRNFLAPTKWTGGDWDPGEWPWQDGGEAYGASSIILENNILRGMNVGLTPGFGTNNQDVVTVNDHAYLGNVVIHLGKTWGGTNVNWGTPCPPPGISEHCATWTDTQHGFDIYGSGFTNLYFKDNIAWTNNGRAWNYTAAGGSTFTNVDLSRNTFLNNGLWTGLGGTEISVSNLSSIDDIDEDNYIEDTAYTGTGARLNYRYESTFSGDTPVPTLTETALWPWSMNDRIKAELGVYLSDYLTLNPEMENFDLTAYMAALSDTFGSQDFMDYESDAPVVSDVSDNGPVTQYAKLEVTFQVETVATNLQLPYDASPPSGVDPATYPAYAGVSVDLLTSPDAWTTTYESPCFYYQGYDEDTKGGHDWYYPNSTTAWKCRFAPTSTGTWAYKVRATDSEGTTTTSAGSVTVTSGSSKGFLKVSATDNRYFEFSDGTPFIGFGVESTADLADPEVNSLPLLSTFSDDGINFLRVWFEPYGSSWIDWQMGSGAYDGYLPRAGLEPVEDGNEDQFLTSVLAEGSAWYHPCRAYAWSTTPAVKQSTNYRVAIEYIASGITGPRTSGDYGVIIGHDSGPNWYCQDAGQGTVLTTCGTDQSGWTTLSATWASSTNDYAPNFFVALRNADTGKVWVRSISLKEDLGGGNYGPELFNDASQQYETYVPERLAFAMDKYVDAAASEGVYLKLVLDEKGDIVWWKLDDDGTWVIDAEEDNETGLFSAGRTLNKTQWLQQAWWRYAQARWGYSTAIHSWEFTNEGDPNDDAHWDRADEMAKYLHCRVFGQTIAYADAQTCSYQHPNRHMVTTSFWGGWPNDFWGDAAYPNPDYGDLHAYINTSVAPAEDKAIMEDDAAYHHLWHAAYYSDEAAMPLVRGETGMDTAASNTQQADLQNDTGGVWYHTAVWASIGPGAMYDIWWWNDDIWGGEFDHRPQAGYVGTFLSGLPLNNGHYEDVDASATAGLRVVGQKDLTAKTGYLWVQNSNHTWRNVVDSTPITPITGTVDVAGLAASTTYTVATYNTSTGVSTGSVEIATSGSGVLSIPITSLSTDTAFQFEEAEEGSSVPAVQTFGTVSMSGAVVQ